KMIETATNELRSDAHLLEGKTVLLLDIAINSQVEAAFIQALIEAAEAVIITLPSGDRATLDHLRLAPAPQAPQAPEAPQAPQAPRALDRLQRFLFADDTPPEGNP